MRVSTSSLPRWRPNPLRAGLIGVVALGVLYPVLAERTQQPLGVFLVPVLLTAVLGSSRDTALVGVVALAVALVEGALSGDFDTTGLVVRVSIIGLCAAVAIVVAAERERRQQVVNETVSRSLLLEAFQDSLVPQPIPPTGVVVRTRYLPGDARVQLGGDFFDAIRLPTGSLGYIIGDVCGQGPRAAAFGASVRSGWKTLATTRPDDPLHWVEGLDETFFRLGRHADTFVTLNTGVMDPRHGGRWRFVSAGHPWPIVQRGGHAELIRPHVGPPLGVGLHAAWDTTELEQLDACLIVLYTDGLIENATAGRRSTDEGERRLLDQARRGPFDIDRVLQHFGPDGFHDDVAVMTISLQ
jgi:serine phosphatase RsbU (regulator of sigma subunit)